MLNARNTPRDVVGSPLQRLHSRRLRTVLPISRELLLPRVIDSEKVQNRLEEYKQLKAVVEQKSKFPRPFLVRTDDRTVLRRNRKDLLKVKEEMVLPTEHTGDVVISSGEFQHAD